MKHEHPVAVLDPAMQLSGEVVDYKGKPIALGGVIRDELSDSDSVRQLPCGLVPGFAVDVQSCHALCNADGGTYWSESVVHGGSN